MDHIEKSWMMSLVHQCFLQPPIKDFKVAITISESLLRNSSSELIFNESKHHMKMHQVKGVLKLNLLIKDQQQLPTERWSTRKKELSGSALHTIKMCQQASPKYF